MNGFFVQDEPSGRSAENSNTVYYVLVVLICASVAGLLFAAIGVCVVNRRNESKDQCSNLVATHTPNDYEVPAAKG